MQAHRGLSARLSHQNNVDGDRQQGDKGDKLTKAAARFRAQKARQLIRSLRRIKA